MYAFSSSVICVPFDLAHIRLSFRKVCCRSRSSIMLRYIALSIDLQVKFLHGIRAKVIKVKNSIREGRSTKFRVPDYRNRVLIISQFHQWRSTV